MNLNAEKPLFITFEGGEGVGKSTQVRLFRDYLVNSGVEVVMTREPGGCENALKLRKLLVEGEDNKWDGMSESLMYSAARNEHLRQVIRPELANGRWIVCDRFADSMHVYQGEGRGMDYAFLQTITNAVVGDTWPDLTIILDLPTEKGLVRARERQKDIFENRFENIHESFHKRVRNGFLKIAAENPHRCKVVSAEGDIEAIHQRVVDVFEKFYQQQQMSA